MFRFSRPSVHQEKNKLTKSINWTLFQKENAW